MHGCPWGRTRHIAQAAPCSRGEEAPAHPEGPSGTHHSQAPPAPTGRQGAVGPGCAAQEWGLCSLGHPGGAPHILERSQGHVTRGQQQPCPGPRLAPTPAPRQLGVRPRDPEQSEVRRPCAHRAGLGVAGDGSRRQPRAGAGDTNTTHACVGRGTALLQLVSPVLPTKLFTAAETWW